MTQSGSKTLGAIVLLSGLGLSALAAPALAGPRYHAHYLDHAPAPAGDDGYGYDRYGHDRYGYDRYGYDTGPAPAGFVFQRHTARCEYPHGWSVTDFSRNINGTPRSGFDLIETGCAAYEPIEP